MSSSSKKNQICFELKSNGALTQLFGKDDCHLKTIAEKFCVEITYRGNMIFITGQNSDAPLKAQEIIESLYRRLEQGENIDSQEVDAMIRLTGSHNQKSASENSSQAEELSISTPRKIVRARTPSQINYLKALSGHDLTLAVGPAGTGKTYLAMALAIRALTQGSVERIILSRPAVEAGEKLGFLPGDLKEKVDPYLRPLYDALHDMLPICQVEKRIAAGDIEIAPLAFMRGRTLSKAFIIIDEAQNTTVEQMKMVLTRLGEGSKMVINGDLTQIDLPRGVKSGLISAIDVLAEVKGVAIARFADEDVLRHTLVARIVAAYGKAQQDTGSHG